MGSNIDTRTMILCMSMGNSMVDTMVLRMGMGNSSIESLWYPAQQSPRPRPAAAYPFPLGQFEGQVHLMPMG